MEPRPDFYPVYVSGQYLTSEHLNETHDFLWQEEKATRYLLDGDGIATGLKVNASGTPVSTVNITAGAASTSDGYLVEVRKALNCTKGTSLKVSFYKTLDGTAQVMEKSAFDKIQNKAQANIDGASESVADVVELFPDTMSADDLPEEAVALSGFALSLANVTGNYAVLVWVYINDKVNNHCQQGDCNTKGTQRNLTTRFFLVPVNKLASLNSQSPAVPYCIAIRIKNLNAAVTAQAIAAAAFTAWSANVTQLNPYFQNGGHLFTIGQLLGNTEKSAVTTAAANFAALVSNTNNSNCQPYFVLFAGDLVKAINELVSFYNEYALTYPVYQQGRLEKCTVLGGFGNSSPDAWRYYFVPCIRETTFVADRNRLKALLMRVLALVNNFLPKTALKNQVKSVGNVLAIPTLAATDALLQHCAIPYYYDVLTNGAANEVLTTWDPVTPNPKNIFCYYDSKISSRTALSSNLNAADWYYINAFRIEGHIGMTKTDAIKAIKALINNLGLPVQLLDCDITYKAPNAWINWFNTFSARVTEWVTILRTTYPERKKYAFAPAKKIMDDLAQTSYRDQTAVVKLYNDFYAYVGVMYAGVAAEAPAKVKAAKTGSQPSLEVPIGGGGGGGIGGGGGTSKVPDSAYTFFKNTIDNNEVKEMGKDMKIILADEGKQQNGTNKIITLKDLGDIEYMGGVLRGGTFVLLHDGSTVVGDAALPYYYTIDQNRVFSFSAV